RPGRGPQRWRPGSLRTLLPCRFCPASMQSSGISSEVARRPRGNHAVEPGCRGPRRCAIEEIFMTDLTRHPLDHLSPAASRLAAIFARPKVLAVLCIVALTG